MGAIQQILLGEGVAPAQATYVSTAHVSSSNSPSFTSQAIGTASAGRYVLVAIAHVTNADAGTITAVTIGGISATILSHGNNTDNIVHMAYAGAFVPTGTTATIAITTSVSAGAFGTTIDVYTVFGLQSQTPVGFYNDSAAAGGTRTFSSVAYPANGFTIGMVAIRASASAQTITWSGLTKNTNTFMNDGGVQENYSSASSNFTTGSTGNTITATMPSPSINGIGGAVISMR